MATKTINLPEYPTSGSVMRAAICGLFVTMLLGNAQAQNPFEQGLELYKLRSADADSFRADPDNINKAIAAFKVALENDINPEESATYLLQSYYFKAMYTGLSKEQKKNIYDNGFSLGERMMKRFPKSVPLKFWYGANAGRWADVHGFVQAATSGIAKKLRRVSKEIIKLDPQYQGGGGYRILAQVHFYSPNIPLIMGWPSNDRAMELIEKAMDIAPDHPTNRLLYAEVLLEFDQDKKARQQLEYILNMEPRSSHLVEDRYVKHRSLQMLKKQF